MAIYCKKVINEAIFQAQMGKLNQTSKIVTQIETVETDRTPTTPDIHTFQYNQEVSRPSNTELLRSTPEGPTKPLQRLGGLNPIICGVDTFQYDHGRFRSSIGTEIARSLGEATNDLLQSLGEYYSRYNVEDNK
ncbi:unnamed protein product [Acanthoscelides obtectus]|uniref:Uncharacterized protein n=1 Tax=Acanthoscelides obtectus TaxID=200917 RepID=A0A9P0JT74_ACAOB|nr:unnamed protein product [Acanthoscelides obtectus]CAK1668473.1 hypothetical protein AOBTE_LOCUS26426 [Acanthoscelides obtectus]